MAKCEKCGKIRLKDAACSICGSSLHRDGRYVTCYNCNKDFGNVCNGRCVIDKIRKILMFVGIGIVVLFIVVMCLAQ